MILGDQPSMKVSLNHKYYIVLKHSQESYDYDLKLYVSFYRWYIDRVNRKNGIVYPQINIQ